MTDDKTKTSTDTGMAEFASGARRSEIAPFYSAIPYESLRRLALRATGAPAGETRVDDVTGFSYEGGSIKYGYGNWRRGLPLEDTFNHTIEHLFKWKKAIESGATIADDDLAAAAWGIMLPLMTFEHAYAAQTRARNLMTVDDPINVDRIMARKFYPCLLRPLSPQK